MRSVSLVMMALSYIAGWIAATYNFGYDRVVIVLLFIIAGVAFVRFREDLAILSKLQEWLVEEETEEEGGEKS